jgi:ferredoxin-NADP reductase
VTSGQAGGLPPLPDLPGLPADLPGLPADLPGLLADLPGLPADLPGLPADLPGLPELPPLPTIGGPVLRRLPPGGARREWQRGEVVEVRRETATANTLRLWLPDGYPQVPGQHYVVRVTADDGSQASRSYSVASAPEPPLGPGAGPDRKGTHIELTIERLEDGAVSPYLHDDVGVGDQVELRGPFGGWFVWRGDTPALLVGGGSGVVPLMAMLRHWRRRGQAVPLAMVVSVRTPSDLYYTGEYGVETSLVYTRVAPAGATRAPGHLDAAVLAPLVEQLGPAGAVGYVCGSAGFAEYASQLLVELGFDAGAVRVERFGPS